MIKLVTVICVTVVLIFGYIYIPKLLIQKTQVKIGNATVVAELATTTNQREVGLMNRKSLGETEGMLFIFPQEGKHSFWMKNTFLPLDILWISSDKKIIHIEKNVLPCGVADSQKDLCRSYSPRANAKYVLEVNADWVDKHNVKLNDAATF